MRKMVSTFGRVTIREDIMDVRLQGCSCRSELWGQDIFKSRRSGFVYLKNVMALSAVQARKFRAGSRTGSSAPRYPVRASHKFVCFLADRVRAVSVDAAVRIGFSRDVTSPDRRAYGR